MRFVIGISVKLLIAYIVERRKRLDKNAIFLAYIFGVIVWINSYFSYFMFAIYFILIQILEQKINKTENRTILQVFCNGVMVLMTSCFVSALP